MVPDALAWQGHGREGGGGGARPGQGTGEGGAGEGAGRGRERAAAADGTTASDTGAAWCYYPERALFVSFRPTAPDFGGRSAGGLHIVPPQRAVIYIAPLVIRGEQSLGSDIASLWMSCASWARIWA